MVLTQNLTKKYIEEAEEYVANIYHPLPVVLSKGEGVWVWDIEGRKFLDMLSAYSALNQGHRHPRIIQALKDQLEKITLTSRAFHNDIMGKFLEKLCKLTGKEKVLPMNTGAEAVETAIKAARKWGYLRKKVEENKAEIIVLENNFHGRTTMIVGFSSDEQYRYGFGPFPEGFKIIPYDSAEALEKSITSNTVGFLFEPIQGEGGVIIPHEGYLQKTYEICKKHNVLYMADEIQTGLGRTGKLFCCDHEGVKADIIIIGKALGGGAYPVSAILADNNIMDVYTPGDHGSTFGGNPLACAVGIASLEVIIEEDLPGKSLEMGRYFIERLKNIKSSHIKEVRGKGLLIGVEINKESGTARPFCEALKEEGILAKETHKQVIRFAPPLIIKKEEIDWALERIEKVLKR